MILTQKQQNQTTCGEMGTAIFQPNYEGYYFAAKISLKFPNNSSNIYVIICSFLAILVSLASRNTIFCVFVIP
jgi:hypothetical protein